jgi:hypothetical protein
VFCSQIQGIFRVLRFVAVPHGYGMNGPPLVVYGSLRRWSPKFFRATLQGYFLPASLIGMVGYWLAGLWVSVVTEYYLFSLPVVFVAILVGPSANHRVKGHQFLVYVHVGLLLIGTMLLIQVIWQCIESGSGG